MKLRLIPIIILSLSLSAWAVTINATSQSQADAAQAGDTVVVNMPTSRLTLKNGQANNRITYTGVANGVNFPGNAVGITVTKLKSNVTNGHAFNIPGSWSDCDIRECDIKQPVGSCGIYIGGKSTRVNVEWNWFHDTGPSTGNQRDADFRDTEIVSYSYNRFYKTGYAAHFWGQHKRLKVVGNTAAHTYQVRGIEIQEDSLTRASDDILFADNIVYDCIKPHVDTFGASIPPQVGNNVRVEDCYFGLFDIGATQPTGGWGNGNRAGYGLETGAKNFWVRRCIFVGPWVSAITSMRDTHIKDCSFYNNGGYAWGRWSDDQTNFPGEQDNIDEGGNKDFPLNQAPPPWRTLDANGVLRGKWADGTPVDGGAIPPVDPPDDSKPTSVVAALGKDAQGKSYIDVRWEGGKPTFKVERFLSGGSKDASVADVPASKSPIRDDRFTDAQRNSTYRFRYKIAGVESNEVQIQPTGGTIPPIDPTATTTEHPLTFDAVLVIDGVSYPIQFKRTVKVTAKGERTVAK